MKVRSYLFTVVAAVLAFLSVNLTDAAGQVIPANVFIYRQPNYVGSGARMTILANNEPIVKLRNGSFYRYEALPGDYVFSFSFGSASKVRLQIEAGREYYIKCYYNMGFWSATPVIEVVDVISGKAVIDGGSLTEQRYEEVSAEKKTSRAGFTMGGGIGFKSTPWFIDESGDDVTLSTGGGFSIGAEYGRQLGNVFDLSVNLFFQGSTLSETLKNAKGSFNRLGVTITPALVIPLKGGDMFRFRLGAGPGLYSFGTMKIDASKIGDTKYTFKYKPAAGFHGLLLFESNFMENGAMYFGIKYNNIKYRYTPDGSSHTVSDPDLVNPDGSGIDFIIGYNFLF